MERDVNGYINEGFKTDDKILSPKTDETPKHRVQLRIPNETHMECVKYESVTKAISYEKLNGFNSYPKTERDTMNHTMTEQTSAPTSQDIYDNDDLTETGQDTVGHTTTTLTPPRTSQDIYVNDDVTERGRETVGHTTTELTPARTSQDIYVNDDVTETGRDTVGHTTTELTPARTSQDIYVNDDLTERGRETVDHTTTELSPARTSQDIYVNDDLTETEQTVDRPPDGGWGWFIVLSSFFIHFVIGGVDRSAGILYLKFEEKFRTPASVTAWVPSISNGLRLTLGPMVGALCNRFSHRTVVIFGGLILCIASVTSGFAPSLYFLFLSYGVVGGTGHAMAYSPGVVFVSTYFHQKLGTAVGMATSGVGIGTLVVPLLIEFCFSYYGYFGSFLILAGLALQLIVCGMLLRPISLHRKILGLDKRKSNTVISTINVSDTDIGNVTIGTESDITIHVNDISHNKDKDKRKSSIAFFTQRVSTIISLLSKKSNKEKSKQNAFDFSLLKDMRYCSFCIAILLFTLAFQSGIVFLPAFAKQIGASDYEAAYSVVITGVSDGVGRLLAGLLFDRKSIKPYRVYLYNMLMIVMAVITLSIPSVTSFNHLAVLSAVYGFSIGMYISQKSVIIVDLLGADKLPQSFGILVFFQGIGTFVGPPLSGLLKDINGKYDYAFYYGGSGVILGSAILTVTNIIHYYGTRNLSKLNSKTFDTHL